MTRDDATLIALAREAGAPATIRTGAAATDYLTRVVGWDLHDVYTALIDLDGV